MISSPRQLGKWQAGDGVDQPVLALVGVVRALHGAELAGATGFSPIADRWP